MDIPQLCALKNVQENEERETNKKNTAKNK